MSGSPHISSKVIRVVTEARPMSSRAVARQVGISVRASDEYLGRLARERRLARRAPGLFTAARGGAPHLEPTAGLRRIGAVIRESLPLTPVTGWTTEWLAPYAHNVPSHHWIVLEAPYSALESLAELLAQHGIRAVINPAPGEMVEVLRLFDRPVVLWPHADTYATRGGAGLRLPQPERLLVDFYVAATRRGLPYSENDLAVVAARLVSEGDLNIARILTYARRRGLREEMERYLASLDRLPEDVAESVRAAVERGRSHRRGSSQMP